MLKWLKEAESQQVDVTEHDLLVAFIYKVSILHSSSHSKLHKSSKYSPLHPVFLAPASPTQLWASD
jgi:hypothetical protein